VDKKSAQQLIENTFSTKFDGFVVAKKRVGLVR